jgi:hypothetical protein
MAENFANLYQTTINDSGGISDTDTSVTVTTATGAPPANFRLKCEDELMLVTAVVGSTFTITRGIEGTTAASHADGATVTHVLTAASVVQAARENAISLEGSLVQSALSANNNTSPKTITLGSTPTVGNFLYLITGGTTNALITPTQTNVAWSNIVDITNGTLARTTLWKGVISASAGTAITLTRASGTAFFTGTCWEFSGIDGTLTTSATASGTGVGYATGSIDPGRSHILLTGGFGSGGTGVWKLPLFIEDFTSNYFIVGHRMGHMDNFPIGAHAWGGTSNVWAGLIAAIT